MAEDMDEHTKNAWKKGTSIIFEGLIKGINVKDK